MRTQARFQDLLGRLLDDVCSPAERDELALLCRDNRERMRQLREALEFDQMIAQNVIVNRCEDAFAEDVEMALGGSDSLLDYDELVSRYLDSNLRPHEARRLHAFCQRDPELAQRLRESIEFVDLLAQTVHEARNEDAFVDSLVTRMWAETASDHFVDDVASKIIAIGEFQNSGGEDNGEGSVEGRDAVLPQIRPGRAASRSSASRGHGWGRTAGFAIAAAFAAALTVLALVRGPGTGDDGEVVIVDEVIDPGIAFISEASDDVRWSDEAQKAIGSDGKVGIGRYELAEGVVRVKFSSGAEMTVEGPAEFEVRSGHEAYVHSGLAMARAEKPGDLQVQSKGFELVDVDRTFAVDARFNSFTEAVFFDGAGQLKMAGSPGDSIDQADPSNIRQLYPFETVRADHERERLVDVPYNPSVFTRTWQLISGVESNSGSVEVELPGAVIIPSHPESDKVQVFLEKDGFLADGGVVVDLLTPGKFTSFADVSEADSKGIEIQPKGELRSYLLQRWAPKRDGETLQASVTFADPVVGVIFSEDKLKRSDEMVGADLHALNEALTEGQGRGIDQLGGEDKILLSDDGRTLNVVLHGGDADVLDHIRVLVARQ